MIWLAFLAAICGGSFVSLLLAWRQPKLTFVVEPGSSPLDRREQIGRQLAETRGWGVDDDVKADLWLVAKSPNQFLYERLVAVVGLFIVGALIGFILGGLFLVVVMAAAGGAIGWVLPRRILASEVKGKRQELLGALAFWAELIAASVGGSRAVGIAAKTSAERGEGWAWDLFRDACNRADSTNSTLPQLLRQSGANAGLAELAAFAESIESSTERGAVVRDAMDNQAEVLRKKVHDEQRLDATNRSNVMVVPVGLVFAAFMIFLFFVVGDSLSQTL